MTNLESRLITRLEQVVDFLVVEEKGKKVVKKNRFGDMSIKSVQKNAVKIITMDELSKCQDKIESLYANKNILLKL